MITNSVSVRGYRSKSDNSSSSEEGRQGPWSGCTVLRSHSPHIVIPCHFHDTFIAFATMFAITVETVARSPLCSVQALDSASVIINGAKAVLFESHARVPSGYA